MKARPILFSAPMVQSIKDEIEEPGTGKTQTRRVAKSKHEDGKILGPAVQPYGAIDAWGGGRGFHANHVEVRMCPYGIPGDLLWVRETWYPAFRRNPGSTGVGAGVVYKADDDGIHLNPGWSPSDGWTPSIHMPRWASRLTLRIKDIRLQLLNDINEVDALAEGRSLTKGDTRGYFPETWEIINGKGSWEKNPYVWAITFEPLKFHVDEVIAQLTSSCT
jgi:hypothetical protein